MNRPTAWMMASMLVLAFSPLHAHDNDIKKWSRYEDPRSLTGLHTKPVEVRYGVRTIYVNGKIMSQASAIKMLKTSRDLSPTPDIVVYISGRSLKSSKRFLNLISYNGLCEKEKCWFKIEKP